MTYASVIIPTRDHADLLDGCLASIVADHSRVEREVVVVDNGSSDHTADVVARHEGTLPIRLLREATPGSSHARNAGIAAARGDVLIFADDDVVVGEGWADALVEPLADPGVGLVGGRILPRWPYEPPAWLANGPHKGVLALIDFGEQDRLLGPDEPPYTANMAIRTSIARGLAHAFEPDLGHKPGRHFGFEDFHLVERVRQSHAIAYAARAVVEHRIAESRMTLEWMRGAYFDMGVGGYRADVHRGLPRLSLPRRLVRAWRVARDTRSYRRANDEAERVGPETTEELTRFMWAGRHAEMLLGRSPRARDWIRRGLV